MTGPIVTEDKFGTHNVHKTTSAIHETSTLPEVDSPVVKSTENERFPSFVAAVALTRLPEETY